MTTWTSETTTVTEDVTTEPQPTIPPDHHDEHAECVLCDGIYKDGHDDGRAEGWEGALAAEKVTDRHGRWMDRLLIAALYLGLALAAVAVLR